MSNALRALAVTIARETNTLLSLTSAPGLSVSRKGAQRSIRMSLWDACYVPDPQLLATCRSSATGRHVLCSLESGAAALIDHLSRRWPATHTPAALGFISDGTGIGFSPEDPCPSRPGWLASQLSGEAGLTIILPFAGPSPWALLHPARPDLLRH